MIVMAVSATPRALIHSGCAGVLFTISTSYSPSGRYELWGLEWDMNDDAVCVCVSLEGRDWGIVARIYVLDGVCSYLMILCYRDGETPFVVSRRLNKHQELT